MNTAISIPAVYGMPRLIPDHLPKAAHVEWAYTFLLGHIGRLIKAGYVYKAIPMSYEDFMKSMRNSGHKVSRKQIGPIFDAIDKLSILNNQSILSVFVCSVESIRKGNPCPSDAFCRHSYPDFEMLKTFTAVQRGDMFLPFKDLDQNVPMT